jgi:hypothetical protein
MTEHFETSPKILGTEHFESSPRKGRGRAKRSLTLLDAMFDIAKAAQPITGRGIGYKLFVRKLIESMGRHDMNCVYRLLKEAREEGFIPWEWIVDETRELEKVASWNNPASFIRSMGNSYRREFWQRQPVRVEIWSEKGTVRGVLRPTLDEYGVGFRPVHGFSGATAVHEVADDDDRRPLLGVPEFRQGLRGMMDPLVHQGKVPGRQYRVSCSTHPLRQATAFVELPAHVWWSTVPMATLGMCPKGAFGAVYPWRVPGLGSICGFVATFGAAAPGPLWPLSDFSDAGGAEKWLKDGMWPKGGSMAVELRYCSQYVPMYAPHTWIPPSWP